jgi:general stress protein YciG/DNA-directed RNA polymerase specialized sigma24 family protein
MSVSRQILAELPMLRRFARAVSGTQEAGDSHVETALSNVLTLPESARTAGDLRLILYKFLIAALRAHDPVTTAKAQSAATGTAADRQLMRVSPHHRIAFLLKSLEGFALSDIAHILDCSATDAEHLVAEGSREIAEHLQTDVLIIEDEPLIALDLEDLVLGLGHRVTGIARTHAEALQLIARKSPGIVLSDIKLADGTSGLSAVNDILKKHNVPVIFITAYPERRREIARKGGGSVPKEKRSFSRNPDLAAEAGRKGGQNVAPEDRSFSRNHTLAARAGRKGGETSHGGPKKI